MEAMPLPADVERYVERTFAAAERATVLALLGAAVIHDGTPAGSRLVRCAAVSSGGSVARLRSQLDQLKRDWRDVIVEAEYVPSGVGFEVVRVRNLSEPIGEDV